MATKLQAAARAALELLGGLAAAEERAGKHNAAMNVRAVKAQLTEALTHDREHHREAHLGVAAASVYINLPDSPRRPPTLAPRTALAAALAALEAQ
jgi:hypothetical protein